MANSAETFRRYLRGIFDTLLQDKKSVHYAVIQSIYDRFVMVSEDLKLMRLMLVLSSSTGYWLDCWGKMFKVPRKVKETDDVYRARIIHYVVRPRDTKMAIREWVTDYLNSLNNGYEYTTGDVRIYEPYVELAKYSHFGTLSHTARFYSPDYYTRALFEITIPAEIDMTTELSNLVKSVKAAGVKAVWKTAIMYDGVADLHTSVLGIEPTNKARYDRYHTGEPPLYDGFGLRLSTMENNGRLSGHQVLMFGTYNIHYIHFYLDSDIDPTTKLKFIHHLDDTKIPTITQQVKYTLLSSYIDSDGVEVPITEDNQSDLIKQSTTDVTLKEQLDTALVSLKSADEDYYDSHQSEITTGIICKWKAPRDIPNLFLHSAMTPTMFTTYYFDKDKKVDDVTIADIIALESSEFGDIGYITLDGHMFLPEIETTGPIKWPDTIKYTALMNIMESDITISEFEDKYFDGVEPTLEDIVNLETSTYSSTGYIAVESINPIEVRNAS